MRVLKLSLAFLLGAVTLGYAHSQDPAQPSAGNPPVGDPSSEVSRKQAALKVRAIAATGKYLPSIQRYAQAYGVDPALVMAVITIESDGDPTSISSSGAMGLMQLMPEICSDFSVRDPFDPDANIRGGVALLASHSKRYRGDLQKVLAAYNAGPRHADDGSWVLIRETRRYVPAVLAIYAALSGTVDGLRPFQDEEPVTVMLPDPTKDNVPPVRYDDMVFDGVRSSSVVSDPAGLAENGDLNDVASSLLADYLAGAISDKNLAKQAIKRINAIKKHPLLVKAFVLVTPGPTDFTTAWDKQASVAGNLVGSCHGVSKAGHVWIVLVGKA